MRISTPYYLPHTFNMCFVGLGDQVNQKYVFSIWTICAAGSNVQIFLAWAGVAASCQQTTNNNIFIVSIRKITRKIFSTFIVAAMYFRHTALVSAICAASVSSFT